MVEFSDSCTVYRYSVGAIGSASAVYRYSYMKADIGIDEHVLLLMRHGAGDQRGTTLHSLFSCKCACYVDEQMHDLFVQFSR